MTIGKTFTLVLGLIILSISLSVSQKRVVCYMGSWSTYRPGNGKFDIENINPHLCTHAIYAFVGVNGDASVKVLDPWIDLVDNGGRGGYKRFNGLRAVNPSLKTLVAIGGWNEGSSVFSQVVGNDALRAKFVNNLLAFVKRHGFNGLDLDWEYPAQRGGGIQDKNNFVKLVRELSTKFRPEGLLLSAAVGVTRAMVASSYNIPEISKSLDMINLMTYDLHGSWDSRTGQNAPLYASSLDADKTLNVDSCVRHWLQQGAPANKLILGIPTYGRTFTLQDSARSTLGAAVSGVGAQGPYTKEPGSLGYNEICESIRSGGWNVRWDGEQRAPFASRGLQWIGYDNVQSVEVKAQYIRSLGLGGAMIWSLETDDFRGNCGTGQYPLLNKIKSIVMP